MLRTPSYFIEEDKSTTFLFYSFNMLSNHLFSFCMRASLHLSEYEKLALRLAGISCNLVYVSHYHCKCANKL